MTRVKNRVRALLAQQPEDIQKAIGLELVEELFQKMEDAQRIYTVPGFGLHHIIIEDATY